MRIIARGLTFLKPCARLSSMKKLYIASIITSLVIGGTAVALDQPVPKNDSISETTPSINISPPTEPASTPAIVSPDSITPQGTDSPSEPTTNPQPSVPTPNNPAPVKAANPLPVEQPDTSNAPGNHFQTAPSIDLTFD